jgi:hypothetical protein
MPCANGLGTLYVTIYGGRRSITGRQDSDARQKPRAPGGECAVRERIVPAPYCAFVFGLLQLCMMRLFKRPSSNHKSHRRPAKRGWRTPIGCAKCVVEPPDAAEPSGEGDLRQWHGRLID